MRHSSHNDFTARCVSCFARRRAPIAGSSTSPSALHVSSFDLIEVKNLCGHDRMTRPDPPSMCGRSGDPIGFDQIRIARRMDDVSKTMIVVWMVRFCASVIWKFWRGGPLATTSPFHHGSLGVLRSGQLSRDRTEKYQRSWRIAALLSSKKRPRQRRGLVKPAYAVLDV